MFLISQRLITFLVLLTACMQLKAQDVDALKKQLENAKNDTIRINLLILLVNTIDDDQVWPQYNEQLIKVSEGLLKDRNELIARKAKKGMADGFNNRGYLCNMRGEIPEALEHFGKSLTYQQEIGDKAGEAEILGNMGVIYYQQKDKKKALDFYLRSLKLREELNDKEAIANSLVNIGNLCYDQKDVPKALYYTQRALKLQEEIGDEQGKSYSLNNLAGIYYQQNKFAKALEHYTKSLSIRKNIQDNIGIASSYNNIATTYLSMGKSDLSRRYADSALGLARSMNFPEGIRNTEHVLSRLDSVDGNYAGAFAHFKQFMIYKDSIVNDENHKASVRSQIKYDFDKKEAVLQEQRKQERAVAEERNRVNKIRLWFVGGGLLLVLIFAIFIWRSLMQNRRANKIITAQKELVEQKNHIIEEKQKEIIDSINYAKRIQNTLLAHDEFLNEHLPQHFVYFDPKDIVSGDFYWACSVGSGHSATGSGQLAVGGSELKTATENCELFYLAVCDSTGHGVPGAFMSLLNIGFLAEAIKEKNIHEPHKVFDYVRTRLIDNMSREGQKDGFDGILVCINKTTKEITYAAANNAPVIASANITTLDCDRMPVGIGERKEHFKLYTIPHQPGATVYLFTDGYADQFGGPKGKKYMYKRLNEKLLSINTEPLQKQHEELKRSFMEWKGKLEQVDDVCVVGIRL